MNRTMQDIRTIIASNKIGQPEKASCKNPPFYGMIVNNKNGSDNI